MRRSLACLAAVLGTAAPALAQTPPTDPAQTTATYDDWVLRCVRTSDKAPRACEVVQTTVLQGQQQPVAQVAVGYDKQDLRLTLLVPPAISLSRSPALGVTGAATPHFDLAWRRCVPSGCFADVQIGPELLKILRSRKEPMQIVFKDAAERDATLPFSLRGLVPALDALAKEPH